ncbi:hypothetical protein HYC85_008276 [Camellia sinensis]|uniref:Uncharacterized protein n=1 Tax=Camellia sinensis TaxID=4442 RepID=A0A7J7HRC1_CAMSI|nr:hypothetical protein HYC85_008276 [Camellia sinensis]
MYGRNLQSVPTVRSEFNSVPWPPSARCAQANRRWPCLQKLRGTLIRGAETCKSIFREGFNMESLEEVLISLGIGGMTSQFAQILQSAFGSRMVPPYVVKRINLSILLDKVFIVQITKIATKQCNVSPMD